MFIYLQFANTHNLHCWVYGKGIWVFKIMVFYHLLCTDIYGGIPVIYSSILWHLLQSSYPTKRTVFFFCVFICVLWSLNIKSIK